MILGEITMEHTTELDKAALLTRLTAFCKGCHNCGLRSGCQGVVFGEGNPTAKLMFVGEGPGADEDRLGRPFVGKAGQLLNRILTAAGITRDEVYIANVVKCRPPGNRTPQPKEAEACLPHLRKQVAIIRPRIIVCLGATAAAYLIDREIRITKARGQWFERKGFLIIPTYHPAALLRDESKKAAAWQDFQQIAQRYRAVCGGAD